MVPKLLYQYCPGEVTDVAAFDADVDADAGFFPEPCAMCGRPASPFVDTDSGPLCFPCCDTPGAPPPAQAAVRSLRLLHTAWRIQAARMTRQLATTATTVTAGATSATTVIGA